MRVTYLIYNAGLSRKCHPVATTPSALGFSVLTAFAYTVWLCSYCFIKAEGTLEARKIKEAWMKAEEPVLYE